MKALAPDNGVLGLIGLLSLEAYPQSQAGFLHFEGGKQIACGNNPCGTPSQHTYIGILGLRMWVFSSLLFRQFVIVACQLSRCKPIWCSAEISLGIGSVPEIAALDCSSISLGEFRSQLLFLLLLLSFFTYYNEVKIKHLTFVMHYLSCICP
jgi:hypothetical protein